VVAISALMTSSRLLSSLLPEFIQIITSSRSAGSLSLCNSLKMAALSSNYPREVEALLQTVSSRPPLLKFHSGILSCNQ